MYKFLFADPSDWRIYNNPRFSQPHHNQIILANVTVDDRMNIQCNASNKHGYVFKDVFLNVRGKSYLVTRCSDLYKSNWNIHFSARPVCLGICHMIAPGVPFIVYTKW